ncbi:hypothetical protein CR513_61003, partial [Mucuna pruriens]
ASGSNYSSQHPECDFYFGCGRGNYCFTLFFTCICILRELYLLWLSVKFVDVIEEDALNMESCVQVLRILITKADTEIEELEKDLVLLQNELACIEHEKWPDICCGALTERINQLDVAVSTLKNDCNDDEIQLLLDSEPAETLHEIVKALQRDHCWDILAQYLDKNILSPIVNVTEHAPDKDSGTIDSNTIIKEEGKELHGISESSGILELLLELHEKRSDEKIEVEKALLLYDLPEKSLARSPDLGAIICAPDHSDGMKLSETSDNKVTGNEEVGNTDTGQIMDLFSGKDKGNIPREAKKENEFVKEKDVSSDEFRPAIGVKGRKKDLHSRLGTSQQRKSGNFGVDRKLCDFAPKTARRACKKESKVAPDEDFNSVNLPLQVVYPQTLCIADTEFSSFKGSNGMQTKSALYTGLQLIDEEKQEAQDLKSKIAANLSKSNMSFSSKLKAREKQKLELEALSSRVPHNNSCTEVIPSTSIIVSTKRQRRSKSCTDVAILNESTNRKKITRRAVQPDKHETEGRAIVLYDSNFSKLQKKRKVTKLPITVDLPNSDMVSMDNESQVALHTSESHSHNETSSLLPISLSNLTLTNLRAMAKQHNVSKYYKLRKEALVEQLVQRLSSC